MMSLSLMDQGGFAKPSVITNGANEMSEMRQSPRWGIVTPRKNMGLTMTISKGLILQSSRTNLFR